MSTLFAIEFVFRSLVAGAVGWLLVRALESRTTVSARARLIQFTFAVFALLALARLVPTHSVNTWAIKPPGWVAYASASIGSILFAVWILGVAVSLLREISALVRLQNSIHRAPAIADRSWHDLLAETCRSTGIARSVALRWSDDLGPSVAGWLHPVILLPHEADEWPEQLRRQVLLHELAHVRRRDLWMQIPARIIVAIHWFNPFAHALYAELEFDREAACDASVVVHEGDVRAYAKGLLSLAVTRATLQPVGSASLTSGKAGRLERRIQRLFRFAAAQNRVAMALIVALSAFLLAACSFITRFQDDGIWNSREIEQRLSADPFPGN